MKKVQLLTFAFLTGAFTLSSCSNDDDPEHIHDHEGIEEVVITRTNADGSNPVEYVFELGHSAGMQISMDANTVYHFEITELNTHESDGHEQNLITEMTEAKDEHFFVFQKSNTLDFVSFIRTDGAETTRTDGNKLGVKFEITTGNASSGNFQIELKHQATSVDADANNGYGSAVGGATDMLAAYPVTVQ